MVELDTLISPAQQIATGTFSEGGGGGMGCLFLGWGFN